MAPLSGVTIQSIPNPKPGKKTSPALHPFTRIAGYRALLLYPRALLEANPISMSVADDEECPKNVINDLPAFISSAMLMSSVSLLVFLLRSEEHTSELQSRENLVCRL